MNDPAVDVCLGVHMNGIRSYISEDSQQRLIIMSQSTHPLQLEGVGGLRLQRDTCALPV